MLLSTFDPDQVRKVVMYGNESGALCCVIQLWDAAGNKIAQIGHNECEKLHEFELQQGERIVGIKCHNNGDGYVWDLQLVIMKKNY